MRVTWVQQSRRVEWLGAAPSSNSVRRVQIGVGAGGVAVETSGLIAPLIVVGILALAIYGGVKAVGKLPAGR